jgi:hypothetical protein
MASPIAVPLDATHTSAAGALLLVAGMDAEGRACIHAVDVETRRARALHCEASALVRGLASDGRAAFAVFGPVAEPIAEGRLLAIPLSPGPASPRLVAAGALDGPLVVHDGVIDAVRGEGIVRIPDVPEREPTVIADAIYAGTTELFWHRSQHYGRREDTLITRANGSFRRPVGALRWRAFTSEGERLFGVGHRGDGTSTLESWTSAEARASDLGTIPGGDRYSIAATRSAVVVASGSLVTELRRADGRVLPRPSLPDTRKVWLQAVGDAVFAVTQETVCWGRGTLRDPLRGARRRGSCEPVAKVVQVSTSDGPERPTAAGP